MIIVLKPHSTEETITRVENMVKKPGTRHTHRPRYRDDDHRMYRRYNADRPTTL